MRVRVQTIYEGWTVEMFEEFMLVLDIPAIVKDQLLTGEKLETTFASADGELGGKIIVGTTSIVVEQR